MGNFKDIGVNVKIYLITLLLSLPIASQAANVQAPLVSGVNIKTVNGVSVLGAGNLSTLSFAVTFGNISTALRGKYLPTGSSVVYQCTGITNTGVLTVNSAVCVTGYATTSLKLD